MPDRIGEYRMLGRIGEGGFGVVYEAEQTEPVRRRVALKVIKPGMDSEAVVARFEAERQALAVMDHPCIAKIYDGGMTGPELGSRPYFVMELVKGVPITEHCDTQQLTIDERCELFIRVCEAVQHAHTKGVVHRDLKPSNVLVAYDAERHASPRIIDFGVAKALNTRLSQQTIFTERGQLIGTPEYMSPEQAEMSGQDIDTRADVYSLGVLLYELLTGVLPFDPTTLREAAFAEIQRIIRETDPPKPSTRLSTMLHSEESAARVTQIMKARRADAKAITGLLRRDLDWVAMRSLEKDRNRRYQSTMALSEDLRRYLRSEPLAAGPPGALYRVAKLTRRHRTASAVTLGMTVLLVLLAVTSTIAYFRVSAAETKTALALEREAVALREQEERAVELGNALRDLQQYVDGEAMRRLEQAGATNELGRESRLQLISDDLVNLSLPVLLPERLTVHHSGIAMTETDLAQVLDHVGKIRRSHVLFNGWTDIGYHFVIDPAGRIWLGRSLLEQGAHVRDHNPHNIGILVLGDFYAHGVPEKAAGALRVLLQRLCDTFAITPAKVHSHAELRPVADPGPALQEVIEAFRSDRRAGRRIDLAALELPVPGSADWTSLSTDADTQAVTPIGLVSEVVLHEPDTDGRAQFTVLGTTRLLAGPFVGRLEFYLRNRGDAQQLPDAVLQVVVLPECGMAWFVDPAHAGEMPHRLIEAIRNQIARHDGQNRARPIGAGSFIENFARSDFAGMEHEGAAVIVRAVPDPAMRQQLLAAGVTTPAEAVQGYQEEASLQLQFERR